MSKIPNCLDVIFTLRDTVQWRDDCGHDVGERIFSFVRTLQDPDSDFEMADPFDVYLHGHGMNYPVGSKQICIRYGEEYKYMSLRELSFLITDSATKRNALDIYGFVHNMLWLIKVNNYTPLQAIKILDVNRWSVPKTKLGFAA